MWVIVVTHWLITSTALLGCPLDNYFTLGKVDSTIIYQTLDPEMGPYVLHSSGTFHSMWAGWLQLWYFTHCTWSLCFSVMLLDYLYAYHMQTIIGTASFPYLDTSIQALSLILYNYIVNLSYHCTIQSLSDPLVRYNLLQVWLSLVDAHLPSYSLAYLVHCDNKYLNCNSRTLGP